VPAQLREVQLQLVESAPELQSQADACVMIRSDRRGVAVKNTNRMTGGDLGVGGVVPLEELEESAISTLLEVLVEVHEVSDSVVVVLLQQPLHVHLDAPGQLLILGQGAQLVAVLGLGGPSGQRQGMVDGPRSFDLCSFNEFVQVGVVVDEYVIVDPRNGGHGRPP
jgi:hypothetical protein